MKQGWLLIEPDEDGNPVSFLNYEELQRLLSSEEDRIRQWVTPETMSGSDPNYWPPHTGMLLKYEAVEPKAVTSRWAID